MGIVVGFSHRIYLIGFVLLTYFCGEALYIYFFDWSSDHSCKKIEGWFRRFLSATDFEATVSLIREP